MTNPDLKSMISNRPSIYVNNKWFESI